MNFICVHCGKETLSLLSVPVENGMNLPCRECGGFTAFRLGKGQEERPTHMLETLQDNDHETSCGVDLDSSHPKAQAKTLVVLSWEGVTCPNCLAVRDNLGQTRKVEE